MTVVPPGMDNEHQVYHFLVFSEMHFIVWGHDLVEQVNSRMSAMMYIVKPHNTEIVRGLTENATTIENRISGRARTRYPKYTKDVENRKSGSTPNILEILTPASLDFIDCRPAKPGCH